MNKLLQNSYFRHDIISFVLYNDGDELNYPKGDNYD